MVLTLTHRSTSRCVLRTYSLLKQQSRLLTNAEVRVKRCEIFDKEKERQFSLVRRIEKIQVEHKGIPEDCTLIMNKGLSTPYNCAMHIQELLMNRSVVALVNGEPWDMHRPLEEDCKLKFTHFKDENPHLANATYWRTCAFLLGHIAETAFKNDYYVELCSFPNPEVKSGRFVHDVDLKLDNWQPTEAELRMLAQIIAKLAALDAKFQRLDIDVALALKMFEDNKYKTEQIPSIAARSKTGDTVTVYRVSDHVDMSRGPLIASTDLIGQFAVAAVHKMDSQFGRPFYRLQGVSLPKQTWAHYWTFDLLKKRAAILSTLPVIHEQTTPRRLSTVES